MRSLVQRVLTSPAAGLLMVILLLGTILTLFAGAHVDRRTGQEVNNFLNSNTLVQTATDASFFAIMAVGMTVVIITAGIDLSVGSVYALAAVAGALTVIGSILMYEQANTRKFGSLLVVGFSIISMNFLGLILGLIGGFLGLAQNSENQA